jgi:hypothetical protein
MRAYAVRKKVFFFSAAMHRAAHRYSNILLSLCLWHLWISIFFWNNYQITLHTHSTEHPADKLLLSLLCIRSVSNVYFNITFQNNERSRVHVYRTVVYTYTYILYIIVCIVSRYIHIEFLGASKASGYHARVLAIPHNIL